MISNRNCLLAVAMLTLMIFAGTVVADVDNITSQSYKMKYVKGIAGDDSPSVPVFAPSTSAPPPNPIGDTVGITYYEYQHNGSMGRQITYTPNLIGTGNAYVHFLWMRKHPTDHDGFRRIYYNSRNLTIEAWVNGHTGASVSANNGGYVTLDNDDNGVAVGFWHAGPSSSLYSTRSGKDGVPPSGIFPQSTNQSRWAPGPPNCQGITSGTFEGDAYIWPVGEVQKLSTGEEVFHIVSTESPPQALPDESLQSIIYYRYVDGNLDECGTSPGDTLGLYIDASHTINAIVRSDPNPASDKVAIIWCKPFYVYGDPRNSCDGDGNPAGDLTNFQWVQHDIVYMESTDGGATWGSVVNVTDYTQGGTLDPIDFVDKAQSEISAIYDSDGILHIIWLTPDFAEDDPCQPLFRGNMWHWDQSSGVISRVLDATSPTGFCSAGIGGALGAISRINISECDNNLYVSFTRFGTWARGDNNGDCSASGYANGELCLTASSDGGITWGPDGSLAEFDTLTTAGTGVPVKLDTYVDLTNTYSDGCVAGDCHNENFGSMAKYSTGVLHIFYVSDHDAGTSIFDPPEGEVTENEVLYATYDCFTPEAIFSYSVAPETKSVVTSPTSGTDCTMPTTTSFDVTITNTGNVSIDYTATEGETWMSLTGASGTVTAGINTVATITVNVGPVTNEMSATGNITVSLSSTEGNGQVIIPVDLLVACKYFPPEYEILSTACWSVGVWNVPRAGLAQRSDLGNMFWFLDSIAPMYDEGVIVTYASDVSQTFFSMFDGSDSEASLVALDSLTFVDDPNYDYAHGEWATPDSSITGDVDWYVPKHPETCVLIERLKVCNNSDAPITIHLGEGIDWDFPDGEDGSKNESGTDVDRQMVYQHGPTGVAPYEDYYGGASFCEDIVGAIALENDVWVYPNSGYVPADIGNLLATHTGFTASDSLEDLNTVYVIAQNLTLDVDSCVVYCKVKTSSTSGLASLQTLIDAGKSWIRSNHIDCPGCAGVGCVPGDADGSGAVDIDDVVYLINYIFGGGPEPVQDVCCGDADGSGGVDIDDVVYLINYIFGGGPEPDPTACG